ncbi:beta-glucosidase [Caulobacter sp. CCNWLY153]|uniref:beta-glucosidase n=1 Tax=unclassified Caulobacter TaxID=2648921 RepID=UPI002FF09A01
MNAVVAPTLSSRAWMDVSLSPDERARLLAEAMTDDERIGLLHSLMAVPLAKGYAIPEGAVPGSGYVPPIPRLGFPGLFETDASLGVANMADARPGDVATAAPSGLCMASTWDPVLARAAGAMIADEAARKGFNVLLGPGANLTRDPRCGRNFEYLGEDPLLAGVLAGAAIRGVQQEGVVACLKHFILNDQETGRHVVNAVIEDGALRESDLLAFQIAIERGAPGSVMSGYNRINGHYACAHEPLLNGVLKGDWAFPGWVMSDWGALSGVEAANAGCDQQSGAQLDHAVWFAEPLKAAMKAGAVSASRVQDMCERILRSLFAVGVFDRPSRAGEPIDFDAHEKLAQTVAEDGAVLLRNQGGLLPLAETVGTILVVGGLADLGVISGAGSSQVTPRGGFAAVQSLGGEGDLSVWMSEHYHPASPLKAIRKRAPNARVRFSNGRYPSEAVAMAAKADVAIVFATQWMGEGFDAPDLTLPNGQDALIAAVAAVNPRTIVILETGGPVLMPWLQDVAAVLEAWYPGSAGGEAIAALLFGDVSPSGRLPMTFPATETQLPRASIAGTGQRWAVPRGPAVDVARQPSFDAPHDEGADVGYRWHARNGATPLFPFGFGLSYTDFRYGNLEVTGGATLTVSFDVTNVGDRLGADTPQVYLVDRAGQALVRLIGWQKVVLAPSQTVRVSVSADRRLLADFDSRARGWSVPAGRYGVAVGACATDLALTGGADIEAALLAP